MSPLRFLRRVRPRRLVAQLLEALGWRLVRARDYHVVAAREYHVVKRDYYAPLIDPERLPPAAWDRRSPLRGLVLDTEAQLRFAEQELKPFIIEARLARRPTGADDREFHLSNSEFGSVDAEVAYALVRRYRPNKVIELGSGWSTLVISQALRANVDEGGHVAHDVYDPYPRGIGAHDPPWLTRHVVPAQELALEAFLTLGENDVLFIDTTHTVVLGSEVNRLILDVLPALRPGVLVHFHDIWLPFEYHRMLFEKYGVHWNEQYLLQAFLVGNRGYEIVLANHAVVRAHAARVAALVSSFDSTSYPVSFWLRRTSEPILAGP